MKLQDQMLMVKVNLTLGPKGKFLYQSRHRLRKGRDYQQELTNQFVVKLSFSIKLIAYSKL